MPAAVSAAVSALPNAASVAVAPAPVPAPAATAAPEAPPRPHAHVRMFERRRTFLKAPSTVSAFVAAVLEPFVTVAVLFAVHAFRGLEIEPPLVYLALFIIAIGFPGVNRFKDQPLEAAVDVVTTWWTLVGILLLCAWATRSLGHFDWPAMGVWFLATPAVQWGVAMAGRAVMKWNAEQPGARRRAVIVGGGPLGAQLASVLPERLDAHTDVVGFFDDRGCERLHGAARDGRLGGLQDVAAYVEAHGIREVYITLALGSQPRIVSLLASLQGTTASLYFVPDVFGISIIQGRLQDMNGVPVVGICETPFTGINELTKRLSDIVLASLILLLVSPLLLAIAVGVKLSSPGPVVFKQRRNGLDGEEIIVYKFRSMTTLDDGHSVQQASRGDSRITPFGAFLRRTSLDELPQFVNVLQGRMSIVGPRPHAVAHNELYRELIKAYMVRHKVKPGITGWAQVNGLRGETETIEKMRARVEYDLEYLRNWSLALDLQIILRTIRLVFFDRHAY